MCCYEITSMNSGPTQTLSDVFPDPSVRPLFSRSVWLGRNSRLIPYNNITVDWFTVGKVGYYTIHVSGRGVQEYTAVNGEVANSIGQF